MRSVILLTERPSRTSRAEPSFRRPTTMRPARTSILSMAVPPWGFTAVGAGIAADTRIIPSGGRRSSGGFRYAAIDPHPAFSGNTWVHDTAHRSGVAYREPSVTTRFGAARTVALDNAELGALARVPAGRLPMRTSRRRDWVAALRMAVVGHDGGGVGHHR